MNHGSRYFQLGSAAMGRPVHLWVHGWYGRPVIVFPTAGGYAHEWKQHGMLEALAPLVQAGRFKLYCPEHNAVETWLGTGDDDRRLARHAAYERFIYEDLLPFVREDCETPDIEVGVAGASLGAAYALTLALKRPSDVVWALAMSGRYDLGPFVPGAQPGDLVDFDPIQLVHRLKAEDLAALQQHRRRVLVCGQGAYEGRCVAETISMASALKERQIPAKLDLWGSDVHHGWSWWAKQAAHYLPLLEEAR